MSTTEPESQAPPLEPAQYRGRTWVTRAGVGLDRIACAWLIRSFIDPDAQLKLVPPRGYLPGDGELRFGMLDAEFARDGERSAFEALLDRFRLADPALRAVGALVREAVRAGDRAARPEAAELARRTRAVAAAETDDGARLAHGAAVLDALYGRLAPAPDR